jgi:hypothetical protein
MNTNSDDVDNSNDVNISDVNNSNDVNNSINLSESDIENNLSNIICNICFILKNRSDIIVLNCDSNIPHEVCDICYLKILNRKCICPYCMNIIKTDIEKILNMLSSHKYDYLEFKNALLTKYQNKQNQLDELDQVVEPERLVRQNNTDLAFGKCLLNFILLFCIVLIITIIGMIIGYILGKT